MSRFETFILLVAVASVWGCAGSSPLTAEDFRARLPELEAQAAATPDDAAALRDLGEAYAQTRSFGQAATTLERARALAPDDPKTRYYLGLSYEGLDRRRDAVTTLGGWTGVSLASPWRPLMAGRHTTLQRALLREELAALVVAEDSLVTAGAVAEDVTDAVAVFPFAYRGGDPQWAPLGRGLAEMLTVDLAAVPEITVVERLRLQTLLDEMALSSGNAFDPATAPRAGRLLRSGRIVGGGLDAGGDRLAADVALWAWPSGDAPSFMPHEGALADLFEIKKQMALGIVQSLGIGLSPAQRAQIERAPTNNLQAFLAYSRGLLEEDAGNYEAAAAEYNEALRLDPGFTAAANKAQLASAAATAGGSVGAGLGAAGWASAGLLPDALSPDGITGGGSAATGRGRAGGTAGLVQSRLGNLNGSVGGVVVPGETSRVPTSEVPVVPVPGAAAPIPDPPPPPPPPAGGGQ